MCAPSKGGEGAMLEVGAYAAWVIDLSRSSSFRMAPITPQFKILRLMAMASGNYNFFMKAASLTCFTCTLVVKTNGK